MSEQTLAQALELARIGWLVHPCKPDKKPLTRWKSAATCDPGKINSWWKRWPKALIGVYCEASGFFALDVDVKDGAGGEQSWAELVEIHGGGQAVQVGPFQKTPTGGAHLLFRLPLNLKIPNNAKKLAPGLDLRSDGYICTGPGYTWPAGHEPSTLLTDAPGWLLELIQALNPQTRRRKNQAEAMPRDPGDSGAHWLEKALERATVGARNETGFWLAGQLRDAGLSDSQAAAVMIDYAARVPLLPGAVYTEAEAMASLKSAYGAPRRDPAAGMGGNGRVIHGENYDSHKQSASNPPPDLDTTTPTPGAFRTDDIGNGERLASRHGAKMRFVREWGWMTWTGAVWTQDRGKVAAWGKETARSIYAEAAGCEDDKIAAALGKHARNSASKSRRDAMIDAAASEPGIQAAPEDFDCDPWQLNVQNGILDLQTRELRPHDPQALMTKIAGAEYDPAAECPIWNRFLDRIFEGDRELIAYLQRAVGYSLTGNTGEQCLFFLYGNGANGKSTFTGAVQDLIGDYSVKIRAETLMVRRQDSIPEEVAQVVGARFLLAAELGEGERLNEGLVKDLVGGDRLRGRLLYHRSFEFVPVAKAWLYGNHRPTIRGTDEGIWRRVRLVPFTVTIPEGERDGDLPLKLRGELAGILNWALAGCIAWQTEGLKAPDLVRSATAAYRAEQDILAAFLEECCIVSELASVTAGALYDEYKRWAEAAGIHAVNRLNFSRQLTERGYNTTRREPGTGRALYIGLGLLEKSQSCEV